MYSTHAECRAVLHCACAPSPHNLHTRGIHCVTLCSVTCAPMQEAEAKAAGSEERERASNERLTQTLSRLAVMEAQVRGKGA